ncbi:MAG: hypothetical protein VX475_13440 [Myxococcota bacterium]|jgi:hypothetical protein|nr:hypothetical protein [Myxococcota bacterium]
MSKKFPKRRTQTASQTNRSELVDLLSNIEERAIALGELRLDGGTQPRERLDDETLEEYVLRMNQGEDAQRRVRVLDPDGQPWPSLVVFEDGEELWLADGFHRVEAASRAGITHFQARVHQGTQRDAIRHSLGVNATHGKRRTNEDKRRAVERALCDEEWSLYSDNKIAQMCKVSQPFVSKLRKSLAESGEIEASATRVGRDGEIYEVEDMVTQRASTRKSSKNGSSSSHDAVVTDLRFAELGGLATPPGALVAYPTEREDWEVLRQASTVWGASASEEHILAAVLPRSGPMLWEGPRELADGESKRGEPTWCYLKKPSEMVLVWTTKPDTLPKTFGSLEALLSHLGAANVACVR